MSEFMDYKKVGDLRVGDLVDLQGDAFADPEGVEPDCHHCESRRMSYEYEFETVEGVKQETPECVLVYFTMDGIGFPTDHEVFVVSNELDEAGEEPIPTEIELSKGSV